MSTFKLPIKEIRFQFSRSSGAGGQNVNKVNTKVTLKWNVLKTKSLNAGVKERFQNKYKRRINEDGDVVVSSQRYRDRGRNIADATVKLEEMVQSVWQAPKKRKPTKKRETSIADSPIRLNHLSVRYRFFSLSVGWSRLLCWSCEDVMGFIWLCWSFGWCWLFCRK